MELQVVKILPGGFVPVMGGPGCCGPGDRRVVTLLGGVSQRIWRLSWHGAGAVALLFDAPPWRLRRLFGRFPFISRPAERGPSLQAMQTVCPRIQSKQKVASRATITKHYVLPSSENIQITALEFHSNHRKVIFTALAHSRRASVALPVSWAIGAP